MDFLCIKNLGVGALLIEAEARRILVDAFNTLNECISILPGDIFLFTHDDEDHFSPDHLPIIKGKDIIIIGPPSIVKPILILEKADINQIQVLYSNRYAEPARFIEGNIRITCYSTEHFNHWDPIHNSYLIESNSKKIFITGDSLMTMEMAEIIGPTNAIICNLVDEGYLNGNADTDLALSNLLNYLIKVRMESNTGMIIGIHLINFKWTVDEISMKELVEKNGFEDIIIPISTEQRILL